MAKATSKLLVIVHGKTNGLRYPHLKNVLKIWIHDWGDHTHSLPHGNPPCCASSPTRSPRVSSGFPVVGYESVPPAMTGREDVIDPWVNSSTIAQYVCKMMQLKWMCVHVYIFQRKSMIMIHIYIYIHISTVYIYMQYTSACVATLWNRLLAVLN